MAQNVFSHAVSGAQRRSYRKARRWIKKKSLITLTLPLSSPRSLTYNKAASRTPKLAPSPAPSTPMRHILPPRCESKSMKPIHETIPESFR
jgi:hypothetical protein